MSESKLKEVHTTTARLPKDLYEEAMKVMEDGSVEARSLNDLIVSSIRWFLAHLRRQQLDAAFAQMGQDESYRGFAQRLNARFEQSDWEALHNTTARARTAARIPTHG